MNIISQNVIRKSILFVGVVSALVSCRKDEVEIFDDPRTAYIGDWNFKGNYYYFSGFYVYNPDAQWTYITETRTDYNDSTGTIKMGDNLNEIIIKYCASCPEQIYDLDENGMGAWHINENDFYNDVQPAPPGYNPTYTTYNIQGWKL